MSRGVHERQEHPATRAFSAGALKKLDRTPVTFAGTNCTVPALRFRVSLRTAPDHPGPGGELPSRCENCSAPVDGDFCSRCGQSVSSLDLPLSDFAKEVAGEALGLDSRLRRTLFPLFFKPGLVAKEFVAGHRARFVPPIRLYLFASFAMFLVLSLGDGVQVRDAPGSVAVPEANGEADGLAPSSRVDLGLGGGEFEASLERRLSEGLRRIEGDRDQFSREFLGRLAQAFFFLLPAFALFLKVAYRDRLYVHHVVFAIYLHAVAFLIVAVVALPQGVGLSGLSNLIEPALLAIPVHLVVGVKRFYGGSWPGTLAKAISVSVAYNILGALTMIGLLVLTLLAAW